MLAGNPNAGKKMAILAIAIVVLIVLSTAFIASRKKTPEKVIPLHPANLVCCLLSPES